MAQQVDWRVVGDEGAAFRWGYAGDELVAEWAGILTIRATRGGELMALEPAAGAPWEVVEKARRGAATAFLRAQRHQHSLHASAVSCRGQALVCIGESGAGKSTLAERLCRQHGWELLADDIASIDVRAGGGWQVLPSEATLWLKADGSAAKRPATSCRVARDPAVISWIVSLAFNGAASVLDVRAIHGADAASSVLQSLVRFEKSSALFERELDVVGGIVSQSHMLEASRSRDVQAEAVADALSALADGQAR